MAVRFIGGGNRSTRRKPQTCCKSVTNFITWYCIVWVGFELTTLMLEQVQYTVKIISMCRFKAVIWFCNYSKVDNTDTVHRLTRSTSWQGRQVDNVNIWSWQVYRLTRSTGWQCQYIVYEVNRSTGWQGPQVGWQGRQVDYVNIWGWQGRHVTYM